MRYHFSSYDCDCDTLQVGDSCYAEVTGACKTGIFLRLSDGQAAFSSRMRNLKVGDRVLCMVLELATEGKRIFVETESVVEYAAA